ncbi:hypothetical protein [Frigidibacter sp. MR17.24]|uniref:hypothetical protein n=1 Tax=Frigidibacter sp. MR17.24 TaxID=3127345 RepID=UPI00301312CB
MSDRLRLAVRGAAVEIDLSRGGLTDLVFTVGGRDIRPLHRAHWVGGPVPAGLAPVEAALQGDFLSAPFGRDDLCPGGPIHGPAANARWDVVSCTRAASAAEAVLALSQPVRGARIVKRLRLADGAPVLVTTHEITGGSGTLTLAHHPMLRFAAPGRLSFSPKRAVLTGQGVAPGRHRLAVAARGEDPAAVPGGVPGAVARDGGDVGATQDLTRWPWPPGHEDFCTLVEAAGATLGWTAALRPAEDDLVFVLKDPSTLPVTMLWLSNGGRDHAPWDGRHLGVVGIEDGCTAGDEGNAAAARGGSRVAREGVPSALPLAPGRVHRTWHAIGAVPRPAGWDSVASIARRGARLRIEGQGPPLVLNLPDG